MTFLEGMINNLEDSLRFQNTLKLFLGIYFVVLTVVCVIGNGLILAGSFRNGFMKTDRVTVVFLETLAALDISISIFHILPTLITVLSERWVLGRLICFSQAFVPRALYFTEIFLTVTISCYRLWMLDKPRAVRRQIKVIQVRILLAVEFVVALVITGFMCKSGNITFNPKLLACSFTSLTEHPSPGLAAAGGVLFIGIPIIIIIVTNILIIVNVFAAARKQQPTRKYPNSSKKSIHTKPVILRHEEVRKIKCSVARNMSTFITISLVCWVFLCCYLPIFILSCFIAVQYTLPTQFYHFSVAILALNVAANPLVYGATNMSFRAYVRQTLAKLWGSTGKAKLMIVEKVTVTASVIV